MRQRGGTNFNYNPLLIPDSLPKFIHPSNSVRFSISYPFHSPFSKLYSLYSNDLVIINTLFNIPVIDILRFCCLFRHIPVEYSAQQCHKVIFFSITKLLYGIYLIRKFSKKFSKNLSKTSACTKVYRLQSILLQSPLKHLLTRKQFGYNISENGVFASCILSYFIFHNTSMALFALYALNTLLLFTYWHHTVPNQRPKEKPYGILFIL